MQNLQNAVRVLLPSQTSLLLKSYDVHSLPLLWLSRLF